MQMALIGGVGSIPRKYFSGGVNTTNLRQEIDIKMVDDKAMFAVLKRGLTHLWTVVGMFNAARYEWGERDVVYDDINAEEVNITEARTTLKKQGIKAFKLVGEIGTPWKLMPVYEHPNGLRIIRKQMEKGSVYTGDMRSLRELADAGRPSIVPLFFSDQEPGYYYELDLRDFGYKWLGKLGEEWLSDERRQRIISAVEQGLRYDKDHWFEHGHLHRGNILVKLNTRQENFDVRIIDFSYLHKVDLNERPILRDIRDKKQTIGFSRTCCP